MKGEGKVKRRKSASGEEMEPVIVFTLTKLPHLESKSACAAMK